MYSVPIDESHFVSTGSSLQTTNQELGHHSVNPLHIELARALTEGFLVGFILKTAKSPVPFSWLTLPSLVAIDTYVSDCSRELSYDHEYAREVWEHKHNWTGEIDEYVNYATSMGITESKAKEIAHVVTAEPAVSVPYHLAFELGIMEPIMYKRKLSHAATVGFGYSGGIILSLIADQIDQLLLASSTGLAGACTTASTYLLVISPVLLFRYKNLSRMAGLSKFKYTATGAYFTVLCLVLYLSRKS